MMRSCRGCKRSLPAHHTCPSLTSCLRALRAPLPQKHGIQASGLLEELAKAVPAEVKEDAMQEEEGGR